MAFCGELFGGWLMAGEVKVEDFEVFRQFRAALLKFAQAADLALSGADSDIQSIRSWLEVEQTTFWVAQRRKRAEAVQQAKDAVRQKKLYKDASGRTPGAVEEEKILGKCMAALEEADRKLEAIKKWMPRLARAADLYKGGVARLHGTVGGDIPRAVALLDRLAESLEQYVQIEAPSMDVTALPEGTGGSVADAAVSGGEMSRAAPLPETPPKSDEPPAHKEKKEGGDVVAGQ
jgi:hypothetical protein